MVETLVEQHPYYTAAMDHILTGHTDVVVEKDAHDNMPVFSYDLEIGVMAKWNDTMVIMRVSESEWKFIKRG